MTRGMGHLARQDNGWNGTIAGIEISVSSDPDTFADPVAKTTLKKTREPQQIDFPATLARYVQIRALSEVNGGPWASAAEIGFDAE